VPRWRYTIPLRLRSLWRRDRVELELDEELRFHLERQIEQHTAEGLGPREARARALREMGGIEHLKAECRDTRRVHLVEDFLQDLQYGLRSLRKAPSFTIVAVTTLALGIGANTAIFGIVNAALLRPLPFPRPDRLVAVFSLNPSPAGGLWTVSPADFRDWREQAKTFQHLAAYMGSGMSIRFGERPEVVPGARVTASFFDTLGVAPLLGRGFEPADEFTPTPSVVLSHRLWRSRFAGDANIIGKQIATTTGSATITGVMPPEFRFPEYADLWMPMGCCGEMTRRATRYWQTVGRLRDGESILAADAEMQSIANRLAELYPRDNQKWSARAVPFDKALIRDVRLALWILLGAVGFVILIACANVAGLMLARSASRRRELAVRLALGASRWRLVRQLFVEGLLVSVLGTACGLLFAKWSIGLFFNLLPQTSLTSLNRFRDSVHLDTPVLFFTASLSALTAVVLTLVPAWHSFMRGHSDSIGATGHKTPSLREHRLYKWLVVSQFACAIVLLAGAGLSVHSFVRMLDVPKGYEPRGLIVMSLPQSAGDRRVFVERILERVRSAPGVVSAAAMSFERFGQLNFPFNFADRPLPDDVMVRYSSVTADYFQVLRSRLIAGRGFDARDSADAPGVAMINETLARQHFSNEHPVGRRIVIAYNNQRVPCEIIGVVSDVRQDEPQEPVKPEILVHWPQLPWLSATLVIRVGGDPSSVPRFVQEAIWSVDRNLPASRVQTVEEILSAQVATPRLYTILLGVFSAAAVMLAILGIYGLLACIIDQRTNELAIRIAVGAHRQNIFGLVIGEGLRLSVAGIAIGTAGAVALTRLMQSLLFEVSPTDPPTLIAVIVLMLGVAGAACYIPARRAANTDPMVALRHE
jgi:putative ABC transport system permease protein